MFAESAWFWSALLGGTGLTSAIAYLIADRSVRRSRSSAGSTRAKALATDRPWRRVGAAIVALVSVMFFIGVNWLDPRVSPIAYLLFWVVILVLILWLCGLALMDLMKTMRLHAASRTGAGEDKSAAYQLREKPE